MKKVLVLVVMVFALTATPAMAKEGVYLGVGLVLNNLVGDDVDVYDSAVGANFRLGYNFGSVALEGNLFGSSHDADPGYADAKFSGASLDLKVFFSELRDPNQFFALVGVGAYELDVDNGNDIKGNGWNLGLGLEHYFNEQVALNFAGIYRIIRYDEVNGTSIPDLNGDAFTLEASLNLHF